MDPQQTPISQDVTNTPQTPPPKPHFPFLLGGFLVSLVILGGSYYLLNHKETIQPQISPTPTTSEVPPTSTTTVVSTVDWKTYLNNEYGFTINYPSNWTIQEKSDYQALALLTVTISTPDGNSLIDIWVKNGSWEQVKKDYALESKNIEETELNSIPVIVESLKELDKIYTFASKKPNQIFHIYFHQNANLSNEDIEKLNNILNSFQLIE